MTEMAPNRRDTLPPGTYWLPDDPSTSATPLRKVSEMSTSPAEMEGGGLLLQLPDFDALIEKAQQAQVAAVSVDAEPAHDDLDHGTGLDPEERFWLEFDAWQLQNAG